MATKSKTNLLAEEVEMVQIPLKDFTFEQLQKLKVIIGIQLLHYFILHFILKTINTLLNIFLYYCLYFYCFIFF